MKKNQIIIVTVLGLVVVTLAWWFLLYGPRNKALASAKSELQTEQGKEQGLKSTLARREGLRKDEPKLDLRLAQMAVWVPEQPNVGQFIVDATTIASQSGIEFINIAQAVPTAGTAGQGEIKLSMSIKGGFFQLLDYLVRMEKLPRTVVIDNLTVAPSSSADGSVSLSVAIAGRMFMSNVPALTSVPPGVQLPGSTGTAGAPTAPKSPSSTSTAAPAKAGATAAPAGRP